MTREEKFAEDLAAAQASGLPYRVEHHLADGSRVVYLNAGEIAAAAAAAAAEAPLKALRSAEWSQGEKFASREKRELFMLLPEGHYLRVKAEQVEAAVAALGIRS